MDDEDLCPTCELPMDEDHEHRQSDGKTIPCGDCGLPVPYDL